MSKPLPIPQTREEAQRWLRSLERAWVESEPCELVMRYATDCSFRQGGEEGHGREAVRSLAETIRTRDEFCHHFELWTHEGSRIGAIVRCEWWDERTGYWFVGHGNARFELDADGAIATHDLAIDTVPIPLEARKLA